MSDLTRLDATLDQVWYHLACGAAQPGAPARNLVLATVGVDGGAEARMVVLRGADRGAGTLTVHTDAASAKVAEIAATPQATLLVWDPLARLQIRLRARVTSRAGTEEEWSAIGDGARAVYGGTPPPGFAIARPEAHEAAPDPARFTVLTARIEEIETLHLGQDRHRRAVFRRTEGFHGTWRAP